MQISSIFNDFQIPIKKMNYINSTTDAAQQTRSLPKLNSGARMLYLLWIDDLKGSTQQFQIPKVYLQPQQHSSVSFSPRKNCNDPKIFAGKLQIRIQHLQGVYNWEKRIFPQIGQSAPPPLEFGTAPRFELAPRNKLSSFDRPLGLEQRGQVRALSQ